MSGRSRREGGAGPRLARRPRGLRAKADGPVQAAGRQSLPARRCTSTCCRRCTYRGSIGWHGGKPTVPAGLQVAALATGLMNPRSVYVLPNGDVLVAESGGPTPPINRPKEFFMG